MAGSRKSGSGSGGIFSILLVALVLWVAFNSIHIVDEAEQGVVLRFGKYNRSLSPGINFTLPRPFETMTAVNISSVRSLEDRGHMLTEDENLVEFLYKVQYRISSAQDFLFKVRKPELTVKQAAESALREAGAPTAWTRFSRVPSVKPSVSRPSGYCRKRWTATRPVSRSTSSTSRTSMFPLRFAKHTLT